MAQQLALPPPHSGGKAVPWIGSSHGNARKGQQHLRHLRGIGHHQRSSSTLALIFVAFEQPRSLTGHVQDAGGVTGW